MCGSCGLTLERNAYRDVYGLEVIPDLPSRTI